MYQPIIKLENYRAFITIKELMNFSFIYSIFDIKRSISKSMSFISKPKRGHNFIVESMSTPRYKFIPNLSAMKYIDNDSGIRPYISPKVIGLRYYCKVNNKTAIKSIKSNSLFYI